MHYGQEGIRWGYRNYQPYDQGYHAKNKGIFLGFLPNRNKKQKDPYRYVSGSNAMDYLTGKRRASEDVKRGSSSLYNAQSVVKNFINSNKKKFDAWNKIDRHYDYDREQALKKRVLDTQKLASDWSSKLSEYGKGAWQNAVKRSLNEQNLANQRGDKWAEEYAKKKVFEKGYEQYYSDREKSILDSLQNIADKYNASAKLASKQYFEYAARGNAPKTKTEAFKRQLHENLGKTKDYAKDYAQIVKSVMQTDVNDIRDVSSRLQYQKAIEDAKVKAIRLKSQQNLLNAIRNSAKDIDKDLINYYSGSTSILPVTAIQSKFWDKNYFEYDAD